MIPFIVAGDPNCETTIEMALTLQKAEENVIELGIPFSDPLADGPVIQSAATRALKQNMTLEKAIKLVSKMRNKGLQIPVVIFTYYNLLLQLGHERFFALMKENDVDGLLVPDLPFEESTDLRKACEEEKITYISLVAPTTSELRLKQIIKNAQGFLYCVSSLGVTGIRNDFHPSAYTFLNKVKSYATIPVAVGFEISNKEQINQLRDYCDGVIIGRAIVKEIENRERELLQEETRQKALSDIYQFIHSLTT
ncbi:tryptophan synthase subunit alpha [Pueribacillus sp. YX66]|uniref:tryptophan synthase subunit alpha n=1 Tax=Pueribacillus sp. YX66 TaxID=3229242 RepID=UPI00358D2BEC